MSLGGTKSGTLASGEAMRESQSPVEPEVQHYTGVLRQAVRAAGFSVSELERRLGTGPKALRRVFCGTVDLKFKHVVGVLRVIGMSQEEFFSIAVRAARRPRKRSPAGELLATFERLGYRGQLAPTADDLDNPSEEELNRLVEETVERVLRRRARRASSAAVESAAQEEGDEGGAPGDGGEPE
jgi:hypothetical protein